MGASSVTGVSGPGDATNKGPGNGRVPVAQTTSPQILLCGSVMTDDDGIATVEVSIPASSDALSMPAVFAQCVEGAVEVGRNFTGTGADERLISINLHAAANRLCHYMVVTLAPYRGDQGL